MTRRKDIMLCYPFEENRLAKWPLPYCVQPKLDGVRCRAELDPNGVRLLSSECNPLNFALPHIVEFLSNNLSHFHKHGIYELDGEIYNKELEFEDITSVTSRTVTVHPAHSIVSYWVFDHYSNQMFEHRAAQYSAALGEIPCPELQIVPTYFEYGIDGVMIALDEMMERGYEGIVVRRYNWPYERKRSTGIMKFKPRKQDEYTIIDWQEEISIEGNPKGRMGALVLTDPEGNVFSAGSGLSDNQRDALWSVREEIVGRTATIAYQHTTKGGVPRFPVVVEVN